MHNNVLQFLTFAMVPLNCWEAQQIFGRHKSNGGRLLRVTLVILYRLFYTKLTGFAHIASTKGIRSKLVLLGREIGLH